VREYAAEALGNLGDRQALTPLNMLLKDSHVMVRDTARQAIEKIQIQTDGDSDDT
jgi:HEAT repeat protein